MASTNESTATPERCAQTHTARNEADDTSALGADRVRRGPNKDNARKKKCRHTAHKEQRTPADTHAHQASTNAHACARDEGIGNPSRITRETGISKERARARTQREHRTPAATGIPKLNY